MKYYTSTTEYNCGIDLHAHQMYVCVMDRQGKKLVHCNVKDNDFAYFLKLIKPYRHDLTVCAECMFGWYWLADACQAEGLHPADGRPVEVYIVPLGEAARDEAALLAGKLRADGVPVDMAYGGRGLKGAMKHADKSGARWAIIVGETELAQGTVQLKDLQSGGQRSVAIERIVGEILTGE